MNNFEREDDCKIVSRRCLCAPHSLSRGLSRLESPDYKGLNHQKSLIIQLLR